MIEMRHPASPTHLPWWFITEPGQVDTLMVFVGVFLVLFILTMGILIVRIFYLPVQMVPQEQKAKYEVVAALCLLDIFAPGNFLWMAAIFVAMIDIPDFTPFLRRIDAASQRIAESQKMKQQVLSRPESHGVLRQATPEPSLNTANADRMSVESQRQ